MMRGKKFIVSTMLLFILFVGSTTQAFAASKSFMDQIRNEYVNFEKKSSANYEKYHTKTVNDYEKYKNAEQASLDRFINQTKQDLNKLEQQLKEDIAKLEAQYSGSKEHASKLREYKSAVSATSLSSPMSKYAQSINPTALSSHMSKYRSAVNPTALSSPMNSYRMAVNQTGLSSPMNSYRIAVSETALSSPMSALRMESSSTALSSVMADYRRGKLTQKQARKQWDSIFAKEQKKLQNTITKAKQDIEATKEKTDNAILEQKSSTINGILQQRAESLQAISDLRATHFGQGITFDALIPDLGVINIMVDGEWIATKQPPAIKDGEVMVPVRLVFETIDPSTKVAKKGNTVTIKKSNDNIVFTLNKNNYTINNKASNFKVAPQLLNGQTMVPLQLVNEAFGPIAKYDSSKKTVFISK